MTDNSRIKGGIEVALLMSNGLILSQLIPQWNSMPLVPQVIYAASGVLLLLVWASAKWMPARKAKAKQQGKRW